MGIAQVGWKRLVLLLVGLVVLGGLVDAGLHVLFDLPVPIGVIGGAFGGIIGGIIGGWVARAVLRPVSNQERPAAG